MTRRSSSPSRSHAPDRGEGRSSGIAARPGWNARRGQARRLSPASSSCWLRTRRGGLAQQLPNRGLPLKTLPVSRRCPYHFISDRGASSSRCSAARLPLGRWRRARSNLPRSIEATPLSSQATASPSMTGRPAVEARPVARPLRYMRLGISSGAAMLLLFASLIGSYFNIPVAYLPEQRVLAQQEIDFFGMRYVVPFVAQWPGTLIAVNVGGAVIPTMMSVYLLARNRLWVNAALATAAVAAVCYWLSRPMPGLDIAEPVFVPSVTTAIVALLLSREHAASLAYVGGSL